MHIVLIEIQIHSKDRLKIYQRPIAVSLFFISGPHIIAINDQFALFLSALRTPYRRVIASMFRQYLLLGCKVEIPFALDTDDRFNVHRMTPQCLAVQRLSVKADPSQQCPCQIVSG